MTYKLITITLLLAAQAPFAAAQEPFAGWPTQWDGEPLRRQPPTEIEIELQRGNRIKAARFAAGDTIYIFRWSDRVTRSLFEIEKTYLELGYRPLRSGSGDDGEQGEDWRCTGLEKGIERLRVCERLYNDAGETFTDAEDWYSQASRFVVMGPWWTVAVIKEIR